MRISSFALLIGESHFLRSIVKPILNSCSTPTYSLFITPYTFLFNLHFWEWKCLFQTICYYAEDICVCIHEEYWSFLYFKCISVISLSGFDVTALLVFLDQWDNEPSFFYENICTGLNGISYMIDRTHQGKYSSLVLYCGMLQLKNSMSLINKRIFWFSVSYVSFGWLYFQKRCRFHITYQIY